MSTFTPTLARRRDSAPIKKEIKMTRKFDEVKVVKKIVLFFDICSSTAILEDLIRTENQRIWRNLLLDMKDYLQKKRKKDDYFVYKFLGDGWILLFAERDEGMGILDFLKDLAKSYNSMFKAQIEDVLTTEINVIGLTFGLDKGSSMRMVMNGRREFTGRPLNVAARLQGAIGQRSKKPQGRLLVSNNLYATFTDKKAIESRYRVDQVKRVLKNISGGTNYRCKKISLFRGPKKRA